MTIQRALTRAGPASAAARRWMADAAIATVVIAVQIVGTWASTSWHHGHAAAGSAAVGSWVYVLLAVAGAALIWRRRFPVAVLAVALGATLWAEAISPRGGFFWLALVVAFFNAVFARKLRAAIASLVIGYAVSVWPPWRIGAAGGSSLASALGLAAFLLVLLSVAELIQLRRQRLLALARSREEEARRRAGEERMRMARELHDVVSHNISVINVQANTALHLMDRQPERARLALTTISEVSKEALVELRSVLGVLREVDEHAPRAPASSLARLDDLLANARAAGLSVRVETDGDRRPLPAGADLAAYRIIQEALTNSARHSEGTGAVVRIVYRAHDLVIEVDDDGPGQGGSRASGRPGGGIRQAGVNGGPAAGASGSGNGIIGMAERAHALGGTLDAAPRTGGGFRVRARLPLEKSS